MRKLIPLYALLTVCSLFFTMSCNDSNGDNDGEPTIISSNTLVSNFNLQEDDSVMAMLDSVKFTVDVNKRVIYNADSLPKGTKITRLLANIAFASSTSTGEIKISGATTMKDTTFTYNSSASDSIDFTGKVYLTVTAADGISMKQYELKVNVHQIESDSLYWNQMARRNLPSSSLEVDDQKTVSQNGVIFCLTKSRSSYTMSSTTNPAENSWEKKSVTFKFIPIVNSLCATDDALYILGNDNMLYKSTDGGLNWKETGKLFNTLIAGYGNRVLAISSQNGKYYHDSYPASTKQEIDPDFPITGMSQACSYSSEWGTSSQIFIIGGIRQNGKPTGHLWGYDGENWQRLSERSVPALSGITLIPYYNHIQEGFTYKKYPVLLAIGGKDTEGKLSKTVYISYNNGIVWKKGDNLLQLPEYMSEFYGAQAFVVNTTMTRSNPDNWETIASRPLPVWLTIDNIATRASKPVTSWECPYIYVFGGYNRDGSLQNNVWKGVLNRLSFKPIL